MSMPQCRKGGVFSNLSLGRSAIFCVSHGARFLLQGMQFLTSCRILFCPLVSINPLSRTVPAVMKRPWCLASLACMLRSKACPIVVSGMTTGCLLPKVKFALSILPALVVSLHRPGICLGLSIVLESL